MSERTPQSHTARARAEAAWDGLRVGASPRHSHEGASNRGTFMSGWRTNLRSADLDWLPDRDRAVARARDVGRNDVIGQSATARRINSAVGFGWKLSSRPNARALGITPEQARELGAAIQTEWETYSEGIDRQSDAERQLSFGQKLRASGAHIFIDGEALCLIEYADDEETTYKTRLRVVDPDRLSNPNGRPNSATMKGGIETSEKGVRIRAWIREGHPADLTAVKSMIWNPWDFTTDWGRPVVLHAYDKLRAGQTRGVTRFVSALKSFRSFSRFTDATLETATINALVTGFVKSNAGPDKVSESFGGDEIGKWEEERQDHYDDNPVTLDGATLPVLPFGDEIQLLTASRDTAGFDAFTRAIIRLIAASLGVTYEELSMDFSQTNYSSARAALAVAWPETLMLRELIRVQIVQPFFVAWLEEAFDKGRIVPPPGAPSFYDARDAYAKAMWRGPGRGYIDPTKEIDAAAARIEAGISTLEDECAEQGKDWEDVLEQSAFEQQRREELGLRPEGPALAEAGQSARDPLRDKALDEKPGQPSGSAFARLSGAVGSALARVRRTARSQEHAEALDKRHGA